MIRHLLKHFLIRTTALILYLQNIRIHNRKYDHSKIHNILMYFSMGIGDFILFTPALKAIRDSFPKANITALVNSEYSCRDIIEGNPLVNRVVLWDGRKSLLKKMSESKKLRNSRFDLFINSFLTDDFNLVLINIISNIPFRAGYCNSDKGDYNFLYNIKVEFANEHEIDRALRFIPPLGIEKQFIERNTILHIDETDVLSMRAFFEAHHLNGVGIVIGIQPGSSPHQKWKRWSRDNFAELSNMLVKHHHAKIIILGSAKESVLAEYIKEQVGRNIVIATGRTTITESAAIIANCDFLICNDSALMHVSGAVNTPVITIYGPTDPCKTSLLNDNHTIVRKQLPCSPCFMSDTSSAAVVQNCPRNYECLRSIGVNEVFEVVDKQIKQLKAIRAH